MIQQDQRNNSIPQTTLFSVSGASTAFFGLSLWTCELRFVLRSMTFCASKPCLAAPAQELHCLWILSDSIGTRLERGGAPNRQHGGGGGERRGESPRGVFHGREGHVAEHQISGAAGLGEARLDLSQRTSKCSPVHAAFACSGWLMHPKKSPFIFFSHYSGSQPNRGLLF